MPYAGAMTPLLTPTTLALIAQEDVLSDPDYATYCIEAASYLVVDETGYSEWIGLNPDGTETAVVPAPRRAAMVAEQLAKRAYLNPNAVVAEGGVGPIGGDRTVEDFARTFEFTEAELEYLGKIAKDTGNAAGGGLWTMEIENLGVGTTELPSGTIFLPDLDPRADWWPLGSESDEWAYTPKV